jgi:hypothetical protein
MLSAELEARVAEITATLPTPSTVLSDAITAIERRGWHQGGTIPTPDNRPFDERPVSLVGALTIASGLDPWECIDRWHPAVIALVEHLGLPGGDRSNASLFGWNDHTARSAWQVVTVLRAVAAIAREEGR